MFGSSSSNKKSNLLNSNDSKNSQESKNSKNSKNSKLTSTSEFSLRTLQIENPNNKKNIEFSPEKSLSTREDTYTSRMRKHTSISYINSPIKTSLIKSHKKSEIHEYDTMISEIKRMNIKDNNTDLKLKELSPLKSPTKPSKFQNTKSTPIKSFKTKGGKTKKEKDEISCDYIKGSNFIYNNDFDLFYKVQEENRLSNNFYFSASKTSVKINFKDKRSL